MLQSKRKKLVTPSRTIPKSPSDTTIYAPALIKSPTGKDLMIDKIANFVEEIQIQQHGGDRESTPRKKQDNPPEPGTSRRESGEHTESSRSVASKLVLDAEQYKAAVEKPQGNDLSNFSSSDCGISDDDFFHLVCHVDSSTRVKIENGQFVDLEKLLPHDKLKRQQDSGMRLGWWQKGADTFLAPVEKERKITNVHRWEQAFRIYSTIYCKANPHRAGEIWQYIDIIHTAARAYVWDNVANYDYIFRQLMEFNPKRSWSLTYNQMWNLSMVEPIQRFGVSNGKGGNIDNSKRKSFESGNRPVYDHCWGF